MSGVQKKHSTTKTYTPLHRTAYSIFTKISRLVSQIQWHIQSYCKIPTLLVLWLSWLAHMEGRMPIPERIPGLSLLGHCGDVYCLIIKSRKKLIEKNNSLL